MAKTPVPTTVIMDGGGNDVISVRSDCEAFNGNCVRQIDEAVSIGKELLDTLHDAGALVWFRCCLSGGGFGGQQNAIDLIFLTSFIPFHRPTGFE